MKNAKGFTLVELMVVLVIIGIIAAVAIPKFQQAAAHHKQSTYDVKLKNGVDLHKKAYDSKLR